MAEKFDAIAGKVSPLLRMLTASDGEILNAVHALLRLLASVGLDIHALADRLEHGGDDQLSAAEMQRLYDKGFEDGFTKGAEHGRRSAVFAAQPIGTFATTIDDGVNGYNWLQIAEHCAANKHLFYGRDLEFIESMPDKIRMYRTPTPARAKWLRDLFLRKFGGKI
jgi:hypothetical protein